MKSHSDCIVQVTSMTVPRRDSFSTQHLERCKYNSSGDFHKLCVRCRKSDIFAGSHVMDRVNVMEDAAKCFERCCQGSKNSLPAWGKMMPKLWRISRRKWKHLKSKKVSQTSRHTIKLREIQCPKEKSTADGRNEYTNEKLTSIIHAEKTLASELPMQRPSTEEERSPSLLPPTMAKLERSDWSLPHEKQQLISKPSLESSTYLD